MKRPYECILDVTERCNLKCTMCYFSNVDRIRFPPFDRTAPADGFMTVDTFRRIAGELFPRAHTVALACAAEPLLHPEFSEILAIAGRHAVPRLWFPTNLLLLTEQIADAIAAASVRTVAVSIDGVTRKTYEAIRVGGRFDRLLSRLSLLRDLRRRRGRARHRPRPGIRIIFTWMRSNRHELQELPAFAAAQGADELDIRFVSPTVGVDVSGELLSSEPVEELQAELDAVVASARALGLRLAAYPGRIPSASAPGRGNGWLNRARYYAGERWSRFRAGAEAAGFWHEHIRYYRDGCAYPGHTWVVRPNGAVSPCLWWQSDPIGFAPGDSLAELAGSERLDRVRSGLRSGAAIGCCIDCGQRRRTLYAPVS